MVSIYELNIFVNGLGGVEEACRAMQWLNEEATRYGLPGVHFQFVRWDGKAENISGVDGSVLEATPELIRKLGFSSLTHYQFVHFTNVTRDYTVIMEDVKKEWDSILNQYEIPYFPHVSIGWDSNPRFPLRPSPAMLENTPENVKKGFEMARHYVDTHNLPAPLVTDNSWNEWTEMSYLLPDDVYGTGYLEAIKEVFTE